MWVTGPVISALHRAARAGAGQGSESRVLRGNTRLEPPQAERQEADVEVTWD